MIRVITLDANAWNICIDVPSKANIDKNTHQYTHESSAYESSILKQFINEGWDIKDWKMTDYNGKTWTFILEKPMFS